MGDSRFLGSWLRKRLQLSVLGLMVLVLIAGTALGLIVRGARVQRDAVLAITKPRGADSASGRVYYNWEVPAGHSPPYLEPLDPHSGPSAPKWLIDFLGIDYFGHVAYARIPAGVEVTDELMVQVGRLNSLEALDLRDTRVDDAD